MYRDLDPAQIVETIDRLRARIEARFPRSDLLHVCSELLTLAHSSQARVSAVASVSWLLRGLIVGLVIAATAVVGLGIGMMEFDPGTRNLFQLIQSIDAFINVAILLGAAVFSLFTLETRLRRARAAAALRPLRAIVHVIDMHQLTKDPSFVGGEVSLTPASPRRDLTPFELTRYLDYCSEMLSLTAKLAALFALASDDAVIGTSVNEIESLTANLSHKIWQKIMIVHSGQAAAHPEPTGHPHG